MKTAKPTPTTTPQESATDRDRRLALEIGEKNAASTPPAQKSAEALMIGALTFTEAIGAAVRGEPHIIYRPAKRNGGSIIFNAAAIDALPALGAIERLRVFIADGKKPAVALFPCGASEGSPFMRDGGQATKLRKKIQGRMLAKLAEYARIEFRAEAIESPRKGWVLNPITSERPSAKPPAAE